MSTERRATNGHDARRTPLKCNETETEKKDNCFYCCVVKRSMTRKVTAFTLDERLLLHLYRLNCLPCLPCSCFTTAICPHTFPLQSGDKQPIKVTIIQDGRTGGGPGGSASNRLSSGGRRGRARGAASASSAQGASRWKEGTKIGNSKKRHTRPFPVSSTLFRSVTALVGSKVKIMWLLTISS
jgi:hypothetical protein